MDTLNVWTTRAAEWLLGPFQDHPTAALLVWSAVTGVAMAYAFGQTSNQPALRRAADTIRAQLFAVKLFKEDLLVTLHCQKKLLASTGKRLAYSLRPMLFMTLPLLLLLIQLGVRYEFRPLVEGEQAVVAMHILPHYWEDAKDIQLLSGKGYVVETPPLRDQIESTIYWRVRANGRETTQLQWSLAGQPVHKQLPIAAAPNLLTVAQPRRPGTSFWDQVLYPAESRLDRELPIASIDLQLPRRETPLLGWNLPWWATFFGVSLVVAFVAGKLLRVQF